MKKRSRPLARSRQEAAIALVFIGTLNCLSTSRGHRRLIGSCFQATGATSANPLTFTHTACHFVFAAVFTIFERNANQHLVGEVAQAFLQGINFCFRRINNGESGVVGVDFGAKLFDLNGVGVAIAPPLLTTASALVTTAHLAMATVGACHAPTNGVNRSDWGHP